MFLFDVITKAKSIVSQILMTDTLKLVCGSGIGCLGWIQSIICAFTFAIYFYAVQTIML